MEPINRASSPAESKRLPSLDGWRAAAIVLVLVSHFPYALQCPVALSNVLEKSFDGNLGVRIFFTISGFIITWLLWSEDAAQGSISLQRFYIRRSLRILPVYCAYLAVVGLLTLLGRYHDAASSWLGSLTFTRNVVGRGDSGTVHFWSLAIEEQFYLGWPLAFKYFQLRKHPFRALAGLGVVIVAANLTRFYTGFFADNLRSGQILGVRSLFRYADCLAFGCLAALARKEVIWRPVRSINLVAWLLILAGLLVDRIFAQEFRAGLWIIPTVQGLGVAWLILDSVDRPESYRILNRGPIIYIGLISYSLYIWHVLFLDHFAPGAMPRIFDRWYVWWIPATIVAVLSYRLIELPCAAVKSRLRAAISSP